MKYFLSLILVAINFLIATAEDLSISEYVFGQATKGDQNGPLFLSVEYSDSTLVLTINNLRGYEDELTSGLSYKLGDVPTDISSRTNTTGNELFVVRTVALTQYNCDWWSSAKRLYINLPITINNISEGLWTLHYHNYTDMTFDDYEEHLSGSILLYDGCKYIIEDNLVTSKDIQSPLRYEWVLNIGNKSETPLFYRMRFGDETKQINNLTFYPLYLYKGDIFNFEDASVIAWMTSDLKSVARGSVEIPSDFWAVGLPFDYVDLRSWPCFESESDTSIVYPAFSPANDAYTYYDFCTGRYVSVWQLSQDIDTKVNLWTKKIIVSGTKDGSTPDGNESWKGEYIPEIGAVGDWYASNLPYPIYNLPDGVEPTTLQYVRNLDTNRIVCGDPSIDASYSSVEESLANPSEIRWVNNPGNLGAEASGAITLYLYSQDGKLLSVKNGTDYVEIHTEYLLTGVYIAKAVTSGEISTYKFIK